MTLLLWLTYFCNSFVVSSRTTPACNIPWLLYICEVKNIDCLLVLDHASLTVLMYSRKFTVSHVRVAYMKICPAEALTIPRWGIMNASMTLRSLNYLTTTSYRLGEMGCSRYGNSLVPSYRDFPQSFNPTEYTVLCGIKTDSRRLRHLSFGWFHVQSRWSRAPTIDSVDGIKYNRDN